MSTPPTTYTWNFWRAQLAPRKITFVAVFHGFNLAIFVLGWWNQWQDTRLAGLNKLNFSVWISRGAGLVLSFNILLLMLPMCRILLRWVRPKLRLLPVDESSWFHRQVAYSLLFWTVVHVAAHYVNFFNVERYVLRPQLAVEVQATTMGAITGHIMLVCMFVMYTASHEKIRHQSYEAFRYSHQLGMVPFLLALYMHATGCFVRDSKEPISPFAGKEFWDHCIGYQSWRWSLFGGGIYLLERIYREISSRMPAKVTKVVKHPDDVIEIQFEKKMFYKPGQWVYLNVPSVSRWQWHPFTLTSCPAESFVSIHIRQVGDFTIETANVFGAGPQQAALYDKLDPRGSYEVAQPDNKLYPAIRIDGAYGAPAEDVVRNEVAVLVGAGIGVTPWASVLKHIWHMRTSQTPPKRLRRIEFFWICRDVGSFEWFRQLLDSLEQQSRDYHGKENLSVDGKRPPVFLRFHTYFTRGKPDSDKVGGDAASEITLTDTLDLALNPLDRRISYGRPDFPALLNGIRDGLVAGDLLGEALPAEDKKSKTRVGVYFCGPNMLGKDIQNASRKARTPQVGFKFWKEHF